MTLFCARRRLSATANGWLCWRQTQQRAAGFAQFGRIAALDRRSRFRARRKRRATDAIEVAFEIGETPAIEADAAPSPSYAPAAVGRENGGDRLARHNLRSNLRFENFVRGKSNELALVAAQEAAIGEAAPGAQGSLFIYGATGLGKTHLLQALGNRFIDLNPRARVLYVTANDFMNQVVHAYRVNRPEVFKARYQALDLLLVDDVQYLGGDRRRTQEEFFFLF